MAERIKRESGREVELIRSGGGVFEVFHGSDLLYSKRKTGAFPDEGSVVAMIRNMA